MRRTIGLVTIMCSGMLATACDRPVTGPVVEHNARSAAHDRAGSEASHPFVVLPSMPGRFVSTDEPTPAQAAAAQHLAALYPGDAGRIVRDVVAHPVTIDPNTGMFTIRMVQPPPGSEAAGLAARLAATRVEDGQAKTRALAALHPATAK